jgi:transcriptional regulator with XRE-family HTH domain
MASFGKRLRECRDAKKLSQQVLAKEMDTSYTVIGKYERDEMTPSIEVAKNISGYLNTTVGYLLGETDKADLFKDPVMLQRLSELDKMESTEKNHILHVLDGFIKSVKFKNIAAL